MNTQIKCPSFASENNVETLRKMYLPNKLQMAVSFSIGLTTHTTSNKFILYKHHHSHFIRLHVYANNHETTSMFGTEFRA